MITPKSLFAVRIAAIALCLLTGIAAAKADTGTYRGQKTLGITAGYTSRNTSAMAGIDFSYRFARHMALQGRADYIFRHHGQDAFGLSANVLMPFQLDAASRWELYPYAGLNFSMFNNKNLVSKLIRSTDARNRVDRLGLNIGVGLAYNISSTMRVGLQGGGTLLSSYSYTGVTASIAYIF